MLADVPLKAFHGGYWDFIYQQWPNDSWQDPVLIDPCLELPLKPDLSTPGGHTFSSICIDWYTAMSLNVQSKVFPRVLRHWSDLSQDQWLWNGWLSLSNTWRSEQHADTEVAVTVRSSIKALIRGWWVPDLDRGENQNSKSKTFHFPKHSTSAVQMSILIAKVNKGTYSTTGDDIFLLAMPSSQMTNGSRLLSSASRISWVGHYSYVFFTAWHAWHPSLCTAMSM